MTRDVTKSGGGGLTEAPKLSPELTRILGKRKVVPNYGGEDGVGYGGGEFRDGVWDQPEWVDQRDRDEAAKALPSFEAMLRPITHERIRDFLLMLWHATKHQADMRWEAVETIYPMMLDSHSGWCFRPERLKLAAQHAFTWFPSVQELIAFMEPDRQAILQRVEALRKVSESPTQPPKTHRPGQRPWAEGGAEDHAQYLRDEKAREHSELVEIMRQRDLAEGRVPLDTSVPERAPLETNEDYHDRVMAIIRSRIEDGARARREDERRQKARREAQIADRVKAAYDATGIKPQSDDEAGKAGKADKSNYQPSDPDAERLGGMTPDFTTGDEP